MLLPRVTLDAVPENYRIPNPVQALFAHGRIPESSESPRGCAPAPSTSVLAIRGALFDNPAMMSTKHPALVWFDTEYTTLELEQADLLQVAMVVTDGEGRRIASPEADFASVVRLPVQACPSAFVLQECGELVAQARAATAPPLPEVDAALSARLDALLGPAAVAVKDRPVLAGNTIHADWWMAQRFLPAFLSRLHYRHLDVSTLKMIWINEERGAEFNKADAALVQRWFPDGAVPAQPRRHDALYDVMASIAEYRFYRANLLR